ncbi:MAG: transposase [Patescibacteria group bacterium]
MTFRTAGGYAMFEDEKMTGLLARTMFNAATLKRYDILAYQIMPDHVHVLVCSRYACMNTSAGGDTHARGWGNGGAPPRPERVSVPAMGPSNKQPNISDLIYAIKSFYFVAARGQFGINFSFWQRRFYTSIVITPEYLHTIIEYIKHNPVKGELPEKYCRLPHQFVNWEKIAPQ